MIAACRLMTGAPGGLLSGGGPAVPWETACESPSSRFWLHERGLTVASALGGEGEGVFSSTHLREPTIFGVANRKS